MRNPDAVSKPQSAWKSRCEGRTGSSDEVDAVPRGAQLVRLKPNGCGVTVARSSGRDAIEHSSGDHLNHAANPKDHSVGALTQSYTVRARIPREPGNPVDTTAANSA